MLLQSLKLHRATALYANAAFGQGGGVPATIGR
jgi:hypothetical protein